MDDPPLFTLSSEAKAELRKVLDDATSSPTTDIPGLVALVVDRSGQVVFEHCSGIQNADNPDPKPMTHDVPFWIASCTKLVTAVACMQLVEQGKLALDDAKLVQRHCPELGRLKVLGGRGDGSTITLRMLLSHTAGFGYISFNSELRSLFPGDTELSGRLEDLCRPLLFEPGTDWNYGINMDWAGILVERVSGMRLDEYFQKNIFGPAEIADVSMCPSVEQVERMSPLHRRDRHNNLKAGKQALSHLFAMSEPQCLGGTGTFGPPSQYVKLLGVLLNDGMCEMTATKILSPESVAQMFVNQIPQFPNFAARGIRGGDPAVLHEVEEITIPGQKSNSKGFGFAGMLQEIETPARQVAWWCGLSNVYWWCDWDTGVAAIVGAQIMPFWDPQVLDVWKAMFNLVYGK